MKFSEYLKRARDAKGMTQKAFAAFLGVPLRTLEGWAIDRRRPTLAILTDLAERLRIPARDLFSCALESQAACRERSAQEKNGRSGRRKKKTKTA